MHAAGICLASPVEHQATFPARKSTLSKSKAGVHSLSWITGAVRSLQGQAQARSEELCLYYPSRLTWRVPQINPMVNTYRCFFQADWSRIKSKESVGLKEREPQVYRTIGQEEHSGSNLPPLMPAWKLELSSLPIQQVQQMQQGHVNYEKRVLGHCQSPGRSAKFNRGNDLWSAYIIPWAP